MDIQTFILDFLTMFPVEIRGFVIASYLAIVAYALMMLLDFAIIRPLDKRTKRKMSERFWKAVEEGNRPEKCPVYFDRTSKCFYIEPKELLHSQRGQRQLQAAKQLRKRIRPN